MVTCRQWLVMHLMSTLSTVLWWSSASDSQVNHTTPTTDTLQSWWGDCEYSLKFCSILLSISSLYIYNSLISSIFCGRNMDLAEISEIVIFFWLQWGVFQDPINTEATSHPLSKGLTHWQAGAGAGHYNAVHWSEAHAAGGHLHLWPVWCWDLPTCECFWTNTCLSVCIED